MTFERSGIMGKYTLERMPYYSAPLKGHVWLFSLSPFFSRLFFVFLHTFSVVMRYCGIIKGGGKGSAGLGAYKTISGQANFVLKYFDCLSCLVAYNAVNGNRIKP